jgi:hypothetical protein
MPVTAWVYSKSYRWFHWRRESCRAIRSDADQPPGEEDLQELFRQRAPPPGSSSGTRFETIVTPNTLPLFGDNNNHNNKRKHSKDQVEDRLQNRPGPDPPASRCILKNWKTREEAEADRRNQLAGELAAHGRHRCTERWRRFGLHWGSCPTTTLLLSTSSQKSAQDRKYKTKIVCTQGRIYSGERFGGGYKSDGGGGQSADSLYDGWWERS